MLFVWFPLWKKVCDVQVEEFEVFLNSCIENAIKLCLKNLLIFQVRYLD